MNLKKTFAMALVSAAFAMAQEAAPAQKAAPAEAAQPAHAADAPAAETPAAKTPVAEAQPAAAAQAPAEVAQPVAQEAAAAAAPAENPEAPAAEAPAAAQAPAEVAQPAQEAAPAAAPAETAKPAEPKQVAAPSADPQGPQGAPEGVRMGPPKTPFTVVHGSAYNTVKNEAAGDNVDLLLDRRLTKLYGQKFFYIEPAGERGVVSLGNFFGAMDISGDVGRATLGYTNGSFGAEIRAGVGKRYFDNDNVEQKVSYNGNDFGLTLSQMLGGYVLTLGGDWITVAEETDTDPKAKRAPTTEERYRDLTATLVLTDGPSARKHFWSAGVNFTRHVNEMEVAGSLKNENPDSYISVVPFFNYGTPALQSEHARLMLGLNAAVPTVIQDEYIVRDTTSGVTAKKNMTHVGLLLTPNVVGEVLLGESVMLFGEAAYQWEAVSYTKGENVEAGDYKVLESVADKVQATVGFRYQYKDWAACEFAFGDSFFTDTKSIFNGEGVFVSFGGFIYF